MYGLETLRIMNEQAAFDRARRREFPDLAKDTSNTYTVVWSLFTADDEHIRTYCTEIELPIAEQADNDDTFARYALRHAIRAEFEPLVLTCAVADYEAVSDLLFVLEGGAIVKIDRGA